MSQCDDCSHFEYDDEMDYWYCTVGLDEDEMANFIQGRVRECPFYSFNEEYELARKQ